MKPVSAREGEDEDTSISLNDGDELVSRYTVQCTTQKQNKTPRVYKARQYTRCTCKMSSATSCSLRVPRGSYVNQERVTEKACLRASPCRQRLH